MAKAALACRRMELRLPGPSPSPLPSSLASGSSFVMTSVHRFRILEGLSVTISASATLQRQPTSPHALSRKFTNQLDNRHCSTVCRSCLRFCMPDDFPYSSQSLFARAQPGGGRWVDLIPLSFLFGQYWLWTKLGPKRKPDKVCRATLVDIDAVPNY